MAIIVINRTMVLIGVRVWLVGLVFPGGLAGPGSLARDFVMGARLNSSGGRINGKVDYPRFWRRFADISNNFYFIIGDFLSYVEMNQGDILIISKLIKHFKPNFKLPEWFTIPPIPKSLQEKYRAERIAATNQKMNFTLLYLGWELFLLFWSVDIIFAPSKMYLSILIRLTTIPVFYALYFFRNLTIFNRFPYFRYILFCWYCMTICHILTPINTNRVTQHQYFSGYHLALFILLSLLEGPLSIAVYILLYSYIPYFIYSAYQGLTAAECIYDINMAIGVSIGVLGAKLPHYRTLALEFLSRQQNENDARIGENISQISHDTRSPLLALRALQQGFFPEDKGKEILKTSVGRLIELVEDITQSASSLHLNIQSHQLKSFLEDCEEYSIFLHPKSTLVWRVEVGKDAHSFDKNKIKRVIINLINNAVRASAQCSDPTVFVNVKIENGLVQITVQDNGPEVNLSSNIFDKGHSKFGSTGLGLHFCKQVILEHGGAILGRRKFNLTEFEITF